MTHPLTLIATFLLAATAVLAAEQAPQRAASTRRAGPPRIIFNCDGDSTTLSHFDPPITPEQLCRTINELADTQVDVFIHCMNRGDDTFSHRTKVGGIYGQNVKEWSAPAIKAGMERTADNTKALLDAGHDSIAVIAKRARQLGIQFWVGMRMNDIHEDDSRRFYALRSTFKMQHRDLLIGSPYPDPSRGYAQDNYTWAFDFAKTAVHDHKIALIEEVCGNYDIDGFELDFQRGPWYFKLGQERRGMPMMTAFVRRVRASVNEIARQRGRPITLAFRVPMTFEQCLALGLDVRTWIREGLADIFTPMDAGYLDMAADVRGFVEAAKGTECRIAGGLEHSTRGYGHASAAILRAGAMAFWDQGASSVYLFNYDCHRGRGRHKDYTAEEIQNLKEIGQPDAIARKTKGYVVAVDMRHRPREEGGTRQLPTILSKPADKRTIHFWIGDDLAAARRDNALAKTTLRITTKGFSPTETPLRFALNAQPLDDKTCRIDKGRLTYENPSALRRGRNALVIERMSSDAKPIHSVQIERVEIRLTYHNGV